MALDEKIQSEHSYQTKRPDTLSNIISCAAAIGASYLVTHYGKDMFDTPFDMTVAATAVDLISYWGVLLPQLAYRDIQRLGEFSRRTARILVKEYIGLFAAMEVVYVAGRSTFQYALQVTETSPESASLISQVTMMALTLVALPYLRSASQSVFEKHST